MDCPECDATVDGGRSPCPQCGADITHLLDDGTTQDDTSSEETQTQPTIGRTPDEQGEPAQPSGGPTHQPQRGPEQGGRPGGTPNQQPQDGQRSLSAGEQTQQASAPGPAQGQRHQTAGDGDSGVATLYAEYVQDLPFVRGALVGGIVYVLNFAIATVIGLAYRQSRIPSGTVDLDPEVGAELLANAHYASMQVSNPPLDRLSPVLGPVFLIVPYLLYAGGTRLVTKHCTETDSPIDFALAGATIVVGYLPAVALGAIVFSSGPDLVPSEFGTVLINAGLTFPLLFGGLAGATIWLFGDFRTIKSRLLGYVAGLSVFGATIGLTAALAQSQVRADAVSLLFNATIALKGAHLFEFESSSDLYPLVFVPLSLVFLIGFLRTWRASDHLDSVLDGIRSGGSIAIAYMTVLLVAFTVIAIFQEFRTEILSGVTIYTDPGLRDVEAIASAPGFFWTVVAGGFAYALVVSGLGGLVAAYVKQRLVATE